MPDRVRAQRWVVPAAWASVLAVYVVTLHGMPTHVFWSPDEGGKLLQAKTIRFHRGVDYVLPYPGERLDPELRYYASRTRGRGERSLYPVRDDRGGFHFHWPMWFPLLSLLPLSLFGITGVYVLPLLAGWLTALLSGRLAAEVDSSLEVPAILAVGLASPIYFYSLCFWEHTLATALGLLAVLVFVRRRGSVAGLLYALPLLVLSVLLRLEMLSLLLAAVAASAACALSSRGGASVAPAVGEARAGKWGSLLLLGATLAVLIAVALALADRQLRMLTRIPERFARLLVQPRNLAEVLINSPETFGPQLTPAELAGSFAALLACTVAPFFRRAKLEAVMTLSALLVFVLLSAKLVLTPQWYRCLHGLVPVAPFVILAPCAVPLAWRQRRGPLFALAAVAVFLLPCATAAVLAKSVDGSANLTHGLQWGPRYFLVLYPILIVLALAGIHGYWRSTRPEWQKSGVVGLSAFLIGAGLLLQQRGIEESRRTRAMLAALHETLDGRAPIVTDLWWLPAALADLYSREPLYVVRSTDELRAWCRLAADGGVERFALVSGTPIGADLWLPRFALDPGRSPTVSGPYVSELTRRGARRRER
jgi:hypothetical protein